MPALGGTVVAEGKDDPAEQPEDTEQCRRQWGPEPGAEPERGEERDQVLERVGLDPNGALEIRLTGHRRRRDAMAAPGLGNLERRRDVEQQRHDRYPAYPDHSGLDR